jgi:hypothetical protein
MAQPHGNAEDRSSWLTKIRAASRCLAKRFPLQLTWHFAMSMNPTNYYHTDLAISSIRAVSTLLKRPSTAAFTGAELLNSTKV